MVVGGSRKGLISRFDAMESCKDLVPDKRGCVKLRDVLDILMYLEDRGPEKTGKWYYDGEKEAASSFRTCSDCGAVYRINSGDDAFKFCPNCGIRERNS